MLDHILVSRTLHGRFRSADVHNETLADELVRLRQGTSARPRPITHAVVAEFALGGV